MRKKIALIIYSLGMGGAEKVVSDLSFQFAREHDVTLILFDTSRMYYPYAGELLDINCPSTEGFVPRAMLFLKRASLLRHIFRVRRFDTIISVMEHASFPAILANRKTIAANHCNPERNFSRFDWLFARWLYPRAHKVIAVSQAGMRIFAERLGLQNLDCLYNPVNLPRIRQLATEHPALAMQGKYLIAAGRLSPEKDFASLINAYAMSKLCETHQLLIMGEGNERKMLEQQIRALGLESRVRLPGFIANPYPYIAGAECLILSSRHEGFPVILIEALGLGIPVIATDCETGPREIVQHGENGLLVPVGDTAALQAAMERVCLDEAVHTCLQEKAAKSVQHLDIARVAEQWLAL